MRNRHNNACGNTAIGTGMGMETGALLARMPIPSGKAPAQSVSSFRRASGGSRPNGDERARSAMPPAIPDRQLGRIAVNSAAMDEVFGAVKGLAPSNVTGTLIGETGTGKDVLAHAIHDTSL